MQTGNSKYKTEVTESITKDTNMSLHFFSPVLSGLCRRAVSLHTGSLGQDFFMLDPTEKRFIPSINFGDTDRAAPT